MPIAALGAALPTLISGVGAAGSLIGGLKGGGGGGGQQAPAPTPIPPVVPPQTMPLQQMSPPQNMQPLNIPSGGGSGSNQNYMDLYQRLFSQGG